jgi:hypothetical protein
LQHILHPRRLQDAGLARKHGFRCPQSGLLQDAAGTYGLGSLPEVYQPVCGTDQNGKRVTYSNACFARVAKATNVTPGECPK